MYAVIVEWNDGEWSAVAAADLVKAVAACTDALRWNDALRCDVIRHDGHIAVADFRKTGGNR